MRPPELINPPRLAQPSGFSYAVRTAGDLSVHIAGHTAMNPDGDIVGPGDLPAQFEQTLANLSETLQAAGAAPADIVRLRIYVTKRQQRGKVWKFAGEVKVDGALVAEAVVTAMLTDDE